MRKKAVALCVAFLLVLQMTILPAEAVKTVYFTAINDSVLPLTDETSPFWSEGYLYVDSSIFTMAENTPGKLLQIYRSRNDAKQIMVLSSDGRSLIFDLAAGTVEDNQGGRFSPGTIRRGSTYFVPIALVASFFGLTYSSIRVDMDGSYHGYLVWIRNDKATLSDERTFADAAAYQMASRYTKYLKTQEEKEAGSSTSEEPGGSVSTEGKTIYLCLRASDAAVTEGLLNVLDAGGAEAVFYCTADFLETQGALARRMCATGQGIGLLAEGTDLQTVEKELERGNQALYLATCGMTRLVRLENAKEDLEETVEAMGYCCLREPLDRSGYQLGSTANAAALLRQIANRRGDPAVWLADRVTKTGLQAFLQAARQAKDSCRALTETT